MIALSVSTLLAQAAAQAAALDCPAGRIVYESDADNPADYVMPYVPSSFRLVGDDLILTSEGVQTRFTLIDRFGPDRRHTRYYDFADPQRGYFVAWRWDLGRIAQGDEPDHVVVFMHALHWPRCEAAD